MDNVTITVELPGIGLKQLHVARGSNLYGVLAAAGYVSGDCGGRGICRKCTLRFAQGAPQPTITEHERLSAGELADGLRMTCLHEAKDGMYVIAGEAVSMSVLTQGSLPPFERAPSLRVVTVDVAAGTLERQRDDEGALLEALGRPYTVEPAVLRALPDMLRSCQWRVDAAVCGGRVIEVGAAASLKPVGLAVDIGTTTVVGYFYDLLTYELINVQSGHNAQAGFGADVISRIHHCMDARSGLGELRAAIVGQLNAMASEFVRETGRQTRDIMYASLAGNTTMQHMLAGVTPVNIACAPFIAGTFFGRELRASELGLELHPLAAAYLAPCVSGYVGGDITAAVLASGIHGQDGVNLLIDIGTNGEIALGGRDGMICCATAAGPAFEGATIRHGVGGVTGAINRVTLEDGELRLGTIGGAKPIGICGSGLIDAIAAMLELGVIDETGRMLDADEIEDAYAAARVRDIDGQSVFVLDERGGICITEKDVREVQLGKAAIAAGVDTMLHYAGKRADELAHVYIAGGFGAHISRENAVIIGLLPDCGERIEAIGNAAGSGAVMALLSGDQRDALPDIARDMRYIELSGDAFFQDAYIERMMFESQ